MNVPVLPTPALNEKCHKLREQLPSIPNKCYFSSSISNSILIRTTTKWLFMILTCSVQPLAHYRTDHHMTVLCDGMLLLD